MYATCLFCNAPLGANEVIEAFPVGRRLAFDAAKGRLWVVCRKCERWNLTPLEERWEAIEQCERQFTGTRRRVSTDNVGLARLPEGLELVRIGAPQRPEMAAWRYGDQFGRRRRRHYAMIAGAAVVGGAVLVAGPVAGLFGSGLLIQVPNVINIANIARQQRTRIRLPLVNGGSIETNPLLAAQAALRADGDDVRLELKLAKPKGASMMGGVSDGIPVTLRGEDALRAAGVLLTRINHAGGGPAQVREAVSLIERMPSREQLFRDVARAAREKFDSGMWQWGESGRLAQMPAFARLALEMASHEEQERRALEGELADLERMWKDAEEIAAIADDLLVPNPVQRAMRTLKGKD